MTHPTQPNDEINYDSCPDIKEIVDAITANYNHSVEEKQHAKRSPSAAKRWMTCAGSIQLIDALDIEDIPSKYAAEGTVAHEIHELCLLYKLDAKCFKGKTISADGIKFKVDQDMVDAVQLSLDYIYDRIEMAEMVGLRVEMRVEVRCSLKSLGIPGMDGGTSDVILLFWDDDFEEPILVEVEVFDYKHGAGVAVDAIDNPQAMSYGLGTILLPELNGQGIPGGITITISQPRAHHPDGRIRSWKTDKDYLLNWCDDELIPRALATLSEVEFYAHARTEDFWEEPDLIASDAGCRFCKAAGQCPMLYKVTQEVAMLDFADDVDPVMPDVNKLTADQKRFIMEHGAMLRSFITAVEAQVKSEVDHGSEEYDGHFKLVRKTTHRKFTEDALDEIVSPLLDHLEHSDVFVENTRSMTEIERRLKKAVGVKNAEEIMSDITIKPEGESVIAPESDRRKAVEPTVISDFADL